MIWYVIAVLSCGLILFYRFIGMYWNFTYVRMYEYRATYNYCTIESRMFAKWDWGNILTKSFWSHFLTLSTFKTKIGIYPSFGERKRDRERSVRKVQLKRTYLWLRTVVILAIVTAYLVVKLSWWIMRKIICTPHCDVFTIN